MEPGTWTILAFVEQKCSECVWLDIFIAQVSRLDGEKRH